MSTTPHIFDPVMLRESVGGDLFDYTALTSALSEYSNIRNKISRLLRSGVLLRLKKGLYVFSDSYRRAPLCRELMANLIYGPSYVSREYALSYHGLIPEHVETVTCVTTGRSRAFSTPFGVFDYRQIPVRGFSSGMDRIELSDGRAFLMATPEKALMDKVVLDRSGIRSKPQMRDYLFDNLRLDEARFRSMKRAALKRIADQCPSERADLLIEINRERRASE